MGSQTSTTEAPTREIAAAMDAIRRIVREIRLSSRAVEKSLGVSGAQLFVLQRLAAVAARGGRAPSIAELAEETATDPSSVSVVVSRLVARRLLVRRPSPLDGRRSEVAIPPAGLELLASAPPPPVQERLIAALTNISAAEREAVVSGLEAVVRELGAGEGAAPMLLEDEDPVPGNGAASPRPPDAVVSDATAKPAGEP